MNWAIFDPFTGRIVMVRRRNSEELPPLPEPPYARVLVGDDVHPDTHYIDPASLEDDDAATLARPIIPIEIAADGDVLTLSGVPENVDVTVEGCTVDEDGRLCRCPGEARHVYAAGFPFRDLHVAVDPPAGRRQRIDAALARVKDAETRAALKEIFDE